MWLWWRRPRYQGVIVSKYSGTVTPLPFAEFRHEKDAKYWVGLMNTERTGLTSYEYRPIARKSRK